MGKLQPINNVLIVKVGTTTLVNKGSDGSERLSPGAFKQIGAQLLKFKRKGRPVIVVTSAAITAGMAKTGTRQRPDKVAEMPELQRLASIGWREVLNQWDVAMPGQIIGELLLTKRDLGPDAPERSEVLRTIYALLSHGEVPTANENDAITHEEIAFGDNDTLAATFAARLSSSALFGGNIQLVILSDVHGVYSEISNADSVIPKINDISTHEHLAEDTDPGNGTGGMKTKFDAARIATAAGVEMWIAHGREEDAIERTLKGEIGTHFTIGR